MDRGTEPAAFGDEILDERAVTLRDSPLLTFSPSHPFVANCKNAGTTRVGRIVAFDHPRDCPPQLIVLPTGKMRLQEFGDGQIGFHRLQGLIKPTRMRKRGLVGR
jgi:hypothetical protein